jgi:hypothetical protein
LKVGDWVEVLPVGEVLTTLDGNGHLAGLPFMPEMLPCCGERFKITAVMDKICGGGPGMRAVAGTPLLLLGELRCDGSSHGDCSRLCTLLWKAAWIRPVDGPSREPANRSSLGVVAWPHPTRESGGAYRCQATALAGATVPMSVAEKLGRALSDLVAGAWGPGKFINAFARAGRYRIRSLFGKPAGGVRQAQRTPTATLDLKPGEWVETKSAKEISATLDWNQRNRGLAFSVYMVPYCGGRYRVGSRMGKFIDERTGNMRDLEHTVILEGVTCKGETTSGICRRAECLYWREIWLRRTENPQGAAVTDKSLSGRLPCE